LIDKEFHHAFEIVLTTLKLAFRNWERVEDKEEVQNRMDMIISLANELAKCVAPHPRQLKADRLKPISDMLQKGISFALSEAPARLCFLELVYPFAKTITHARKTKEQFQFLTIIREHWTKGIRSLPNKAKDAVFSTSRKYSKEKSAFIEFEDLIGLKTKNAKGQRVTAPSASPAKTTTGGKRKRPEPLDLKSKAPAANVRKSSRLATGERKSLREDEYDEDEFNGDEDEAELSNNAKAKLENEKKRENMEEKRKQKDAREIGKSVFADSSSENTDSFSEPRKRKLSSTITRKEGSLFENPSDDDDSDDDADEAEEITGFVKKRPRR